ncbi:dipeptidyl aminopeptidase, partial [Nocardia gipuzkoensis]
RMLPPFLTEWVWAERHAEVNSVVAMMISFSAELRWAINNGVWTFGVTSPAEFIRRTRPYTLTGLADRIACPTLVFDAENDQFFGGEAQRLYDALTCPKQRILGTDADGAGEHCHMGAMLLTHQRLFDWLDRTPASVDAVTV